MLVLYVYHLLYTDYINNYYLIVYKIWYRHSGQPEIDEIPFSPTPTTIQVEREITLDEGHYITHMGIYGRVLPSLSTIAPRLTHLQIRHLSDISQLQRYICIFSI